MVKPDTRSIDERDDPHARTLRHLRTNRNALDHVAANLHSALTKQWDERAAWDALPEPDRDYWRREVVRRYEEHDYSGLGGMDEQLAMNDAACREQEAAPHANDPEGT